MSEPEAEMGADAAVEAEVKAEEQGAAKDQEKEKRTETEEDAEETESGGRSRKRMRQRKRQMYDRIKRQMEFYFSDANLAKDRYLGELTRVGQEGEGTGEVPLEVFLKFNKIRGMTQDIQDIVKAIKNSEFLICSDDDLKVRRKTRLEPYDADQRTVYVESIPATAGRDWLQDIFKTYGPVAYISLPTFKNSQKIKGYAFIEFTKPEGAQKCLNAFTKMGCKMPTCMPPEELSTIKLFAVENPPDDLPSNETTKVEDRASPAKTSNVEETKTATKTVKVEETEPGDNKSKLEESDSSTKTANVDIESPAKKRKVDEKESTAKTPKVEGTESQVQPKENVPENPSKGKKREFQNERGDEPPKKKQKRQRDKKSRKSLDNKSMDELNVSNDKEASTVEGAEKTENISTECTESKEEVTSQDDAAKSADATTEKKKKNRKRTAKERNKSKKGLNKKEAPKGALWGLQVLSKSEWKALRNKYLNLQRKRMKDLKNSLRSKGTRHFTERWDVADITEKTVDDTAAKREVEERTAGVFVRIELAEPCLDVRLTKRSVRTNVHVQHVDVKEGQTDMVVRFDAPEAAKQYCESGVYSRARVLDEAESSEQWERAAAARSGGKRARGRTKLLQRAADVSVKPQGPPPVVAVTPATHIRFDE